MLKFLILACYFCAVDVQLGAEVSAPEQWRRAILSATVSGNYHAQPAVVPRSRLNEARTLVERRRWNFFYVSEPPGRDRWFNRKTVDGIPAGDCEEFVGLLMEDFEAAGMPGVVHMVVLRNPEGQGHATAAINTADGWFMADLWFWTARKLRAGGYEPLSLSMPGTNTWRRVNLLPE